MVYSAAMGHTTRDKKKLLDRIRRIRGQVEAVEKSIANDDECSKTLLTVAACRGAINGLTAEILEGHIRHHILEPGRRKTSKQAVAVEELIDVIRTYLR